MTSFRQRISLIVLGLILAVLLLELSLRLAGFFIVTAQEFRNRHALSDKNTFRILCIGESTTEGQYPAFLEKILNSQNLGIHFKVIDQGVIATNTSLILSELDKNLDIYQPQMVLAMIGINDWSVHMPPVEIPTTIPVINFLRSLKCYKLLRLIKLHLESKLQSIDKNSHYSKAYIQSQREVELGKKYRVQGNTTLAIIKFKEAIRVDPQNTDAYFNLYWITPDIKLKNIILSEISKSLEAGIKAESNDEILYEYSSLGVYLLESCYKYDEAIRIFSKIIALRPNRDEAYLWLGKSYFGKGDLTSAKKMYEKAITLNNKNRKGYDGLSILYRDIGNLQLAHEYSVKADEADPRGLFPATANNYRSIKNILDLRKIPLVCIQYPLRPVSLLKGLFPKEDVIFVDNEETFQKALAKGEYRDYFRDMFAGDFGHCTDKGNKLLAKNIAQAILKEILASK